MKKSIALLIVLIALFNSFGCKNKAALDANGMPGKLVIAIYVGGDNPNGLKAALVPFKYYLEKKLGIEVEYNYSTDLHLCYRGFKGKKGARGLFEPLLIRAGFAKT